MRQLKREVKIGNVTIGGNNPIAVQTMLNVPVEDIEGNVAQAKRCEAAGCQILRVTCPSAADAKCIEAVKNAVNIPIVADIHFDYKAALACADVGVDKIRINPGNIGDDDRVKAVVQACQQKNIPIRIGVNGGSLEKHILAKYGAPVPEAMVESALYHVHLLEKFDFNNIVISIKNSNVPRMMEAYRQLSAVTDYPLHVGVTEAGTYQMGLLKSGMGIGGMLLEGIGDTIRVSLAAEPEKEVEAGYNILRAVGFPVAGPEVITCPTCGRTQYPCTEIANEVEKRLQGYKKSIKVAVMGCVVNGPGEAREADYGIANLGSIVQMKDDIDCRIVETVSDVYVGIVKLSKIVDTFDDMIDIMAETKPFPKFAGIITGPSRTADIECVGTVGVHGPRQYSVIVVEDA